MVQLCFRSSPREWHLSSIFQYCSPYFKQAVTAYSFTSSNVQYLAWLKLKPDSKICVILSSKCFFLQKNPYMWKSPCHTCNTTCHTSLYTMFLDIFQQNSTRHTRQLRFFVHNILKSKVWRVWLAPFHLNVLVQKCCDRSYDVCDMLSCFFKVQRGFKNPLVCKKLLWFLWTKKTSKNNHQQIGMSI